MNVLHVIPSLALTDGGPPWVVAGLADAAVAAGASVTVVALDTAATAEAQAFDERVDVRLFPCEGRGRLRWSGELARWLAAEARRFDVVHAHSVYTAVTRATLDAAQSGDGRVLVTPHGALMTGAVRPWQVWKHVWVAVRLRTRARRRLHLHYLTDVEQQRSRWAGMRSLVHAPLWRLRSSTSREAASRAGDYVLALGRVHPVKRLELIVQGLPATRELRLVIAGSGDARYVNQVKGIARRLAVNDRVEWRGRVSGDEKQELLRRARCLVQASRFESFGIAVLEGLAAGVPAAVAGDVAAAQWVQAGDAGIVVGSEPRCWSDALRSLESEVTLWDQFAANAWRWSSALPSRVQQGAELLRLYGSLAA
jgi:glycosyltransferase involved in cell wall biosynthesis